MCVCVLYKVRDTATQEKTRKQGGKGVREKRQRERTAYTKPMRVLKLPSLADGLNSISDWPIEY